MASAPTRSPGAVTVLGAGAIGTAVAHALASAGRAVTVWNRSSGRSRALSETATIAPTAAAASAASPLVLLCLTDYVAVADVLAVAAPSLRGRTVVVLATGSPHEARDAAQLAVRAGAMYIDAGVQSAPEAIGDSRTTVLFSGSFAGFEEHRATLALLATPLWLGADPGAAAVHDLALFGLWYDAQIGHLRALQTVRAAGLAPEALMAFAATAATQLGYVASSAIDTARELLAREFPRGPADLSEHAPVLDRLADLRRGQRLGDGDLAVVRELVRERVAAGHGEEGLNGIAL